MVCFYVYGYGGLFGICRVHNLIIRICRNACNLKQAETTSQK